MARHFNTERDDLDAQLRACFGSEKPHVYFNPPENLKMEYPAIRYSRTGGRNIHASNAVHAQTNTYKIVVIDRDSDSLIARAVRRIPHCAKGTEYKSDNLYHFQFTISLFIKEVPK